MAADLTPIHPACMLSSAATISTHKQCSHIHPLPVPSSACYHHRRSTCPNTTAHPSNLLHPQHQPPRRQALLAAPHLPVGKQLQAHILASLFEGLDAHLHPPISKCAPLFATPCTRMRCLFCQRYSLQFLQAPRYPRTVLLRSRICRTVGCKQAVG
jgi:hypothetical protein